MSRRSRDKGARGERAIARLLQAEGFSAEKVSRIYRPGADTCVLLLGTDGAIVATGFDMVPEPPAANYSRLACLADLGLIWLLRGRPVIVLPSTEAIIRCPSGATLTYHRRNEPAPATKIVTPAAAKIANAQIATPIVAEIAKRTTP
jgi:hypothetical protein